MYKEEAKLFMNEKKILRSFGQCYNKKDFNNITGLFADDIKYESFDCMYSVRSAKDVSNVLIESVLPKTNIFLGFYMYRGVLYKRLKECVLICNSTTLECMRLINIRTKRGKIVNITGLDPKEYVHTRGMIIND